MKRDSARALGCDEVRDELWRLVGLDATQTLDQFPRLADHVERCRECRRRLDAMMVVSDEDQAGHYGPPAWPSIDSPKKDEDGGAG